MTTSENFRHLPWSARCTLILGRRIRTAPTNRHPPAQYPARLLVYYHRQNHVRHLVTRRMFTSRRHGNRCRLSLRPWEQNNHCPTLDLSHPHPLSRHQPLSIMHRSLQIRRPWIHAKDHSNRTLIAPKDRLIRSRTLVVLSSTRLLLRCHPHPHLHHRAKWIRHLDHHMSHVSHTRLHNTTQDCRHCTPSKLRSHHHRLWLGRTCHILRTHQRRHQLTNLLLLNQPVP